MVNSAFGQLRHGMLDRAPKPFRAICSFSTSATRRSYGSRVCAPRQAPALLRRTRTHSGRSGLFSETEQDSLRAALSPLSWRDIFSPVRAGVYGMIGQTRQLLSDGILASRCTLRFVLKQVRYVCHTSDMNGPHLSSWVCFSSDKRHHIFGSKTSWYCGGAESPFRNLHRSMSSIAYLQLYAMCVR